MQYRYTISQLCDLFSLCGRDDRSVRNLLARSKIDPDGQNAAGLKTWDIRQVLFALDRVVGKDELAEAKLEGVKLDNERKTLELARAQEELRSEQRAADLAEFREALGALRRALGALPGDDVLAALAEAEQWAQSQPL